jgi:hypothetical protein
MEAISYICNVGTYRAVVAVEEHVDFCCNIISSSYDITGGKTGNSWLAKDEQASEEGLCPIKLLHWLLLFVLFFVCFWRNSQKWVRASSFTGFLDHTQRRTTVGRTPLDKWSARHRDFYLTTHNTPALTINQYPCPRWDSNALVT